MLTNSALNFHKIEYLRYCIYIYQQYFYNEFLFELVIAYVFYYMGFKTEKVSC